LVNLKFQQKVILYQVLGRAEMPHNERLIPMQCEHQMLPLGTFHGRIVFKEFLKKHKLRIHLAQNGIQWKALLNTVPLKAWNIF
jgi:hypothetical protein